MMGKPSGKKKKHLGGKTSDANLKQNRSGELSGKTFDDDTTVFINMSQELKEEGNKLFQKRDHEGAMLRYEKALKLLPKSHVDVAYLRSNMAACFMQMGPDEYHKAIKECDLALEVSPKYSKALLKRARCYEAVNRLDLALKDIGVVLSLEPNNLMALEIAERVRKGIKKKGIKMDDKGVVLVKNYIESPCNSPQFKVVKEKTRKKKSSKVEETKSEEKIIVEKNDNAKEETMRTVKLVLGEDIRWAQLPADCTILQLREIVRNRFPGSKAVLIKYKDQEGDLVTITTTEELRWAEASAEPQGSVRLYIIQVNPEQELLLFEEEKTQVELQKLEINQNNVSENGNMKPGLEKESSYIDDWVVQFARHFKNHVGLDSDAYLDLHEIGIKLYAEAMEDSVTSEEAQDLFEIAAEQFQEMAALALFNCGNAHMSRARKRVVLPEDASRESILAEVKGANEWAQREYERAGESYEEALKIKPDFYEGLLALGQQQFEQAKLSWYFAVGSKLDLKTWPSKGVIELFDNAEANMDRGTQMWEEMESQRLSKLSTPVKEETPLQKMGLDGLFKEMSTDEAAERAANMRSQINILWGTMLYERSVVEFKLGVEFWEDCLEAAIEKFELAGASRIDTAVMRKNHCSNETAQEGLVFKIDEIVQAWNEMYDAKRWKSGVPSFRLEPLFRRPGPKLHHILEHL
ncbi:protein PHOX1-like [Tasmannia lanceolata]|uniref:protein PHOX1-like n=1 Tax=Tasmannia lanceolata TaxID=3420 RepID=UPI0040648107